MKPYIGVTHGNARLTWAQVQAIRAARAQDNPPSLRSLGARYGVSPVMIHHIAKGTRWSPAREPIHTIAGGGK